LNINLTFLDWPIDESNLSVTKMYCLGVCGKILASGSQSEAIMWLRFCHWASKHQHIYSMWQRICHWASQHQLSLKVGADLW